jgi:hypothetical protein
MSVHSIQYRKVNIRTVRKKIRTVSNPCRKWDSTSYTNEPTDLHIVCLSAGQRGMSVARPGDCCLWILTSQVRRGHNYPLPYNRPRRLDGPRSSRLWLSRWVSTAHPSTIVAERVSTILTSRRRNLTTISIRFFIVSQNKMLRLNVWTWRSRRTVQKTT